MRYYLWCPDTDGTQHTACATDEQRAAYPWGLRIPSENEVVAYLNRPIDQTLPTISIIQNPWRHVTHVPTNMATPCHWDRIGTLGIPDFSDVHGKGSVSVGNWGNATELYPAIRANYRCSVHGKAPTQVYMRHHAFSRRWEPIRSRLTKQVRRARTDEELRQHLGIHHTDVMNGPFHGRRYFTHIYYECAVRVVETTHENW